MYAVTALVVLVFLDCHVYISLSTYIHVIAGEGVAALRRRTGPARLVDEVGLMARHLLHVIPQQFQQRHWYIRGHVGDHAQPV